MRSSTYALVFASAAILATAVKAVRPGGSQSGKSLDVPSAHHPMAAHKLGPQDSRVLTIMWISGLAGMALVTLVLYRSKGLLVVVRIQLYLIALSTVTISVKNVYVNHDFTYSKALSALHMICCILFAWTLLVVQRLVYGNLLIIPSCRQFSYLIMPIAIVFGLGIVLNNMALTFSTASTVEAIGATTPLYVAGLSVSIGRKVHTGLFLPLSMVVGGVMFSVSSDITFSFSGVALAVLAAFLRGCKSVMHFELMTPQDDLGESNEPVLDPLSVLAWMSLPTAVMMVLWSGYSEGDQPFRHLTKNFSWSLVIAVGVSCLNAVLLNLTALYVLKDLGTVASQVAGQLKTVLVVLGSVAMLGDYVQPMQILGICIAFLGISWYNTRERALTLKDPLDMLANNVRNGK